VARAAGFEAAPPGARDGGRAGASVAGADSAMGLFYNPATLLAGPGLVDGSVTLHANFGNVCFRRTEVTEDASGGRSPGATLPEVCSGNSAALVPQFATALHLGARRELSVGLGLYTPVPARRSSSLGDTEPSRYLLTKFDVLQLFPTIGLAYAPHRQVRLGASFGWGITTFDYALVTYSRVVVLPPDTGATSDVSVSTKGTDPFIPRVQVGTVVQPAASLPLTLALEYTFTGDVQIENGKTAVSGLATDYYTSTPLLQGFLPTQDPVIAGSVSGVKVEIPQTSRVSGGVRYAHPLDKPADGVGDRLSTERFDLELDAVLTLSNNVRSFDATLPPTTIVVPPPSPLLGPTNVQLPERLALPHRFRNQLGLRLGGDYSVLPGRLALRGGVQYETSGVRRGYQQLDFLPTDRWGLSLGATVRIIDALDVSVAYTHFFIRTAQVGVRDAQLRRTVSGSPNEGDDILINAGRITQQLDALAFELTSRF
jgi:Outer membrane protein transport protein (OMPP1/FadL/TodX)